MIQPGYGVDKQAFSQHRRRAEPPGTNPQMPHDLAQRRTSIFRLAGPVGLAIAMLAACAPSTSTMQLYPLQGEIADADPTLVIRATAKNTTGTSGALTFRLPERGKCSGTWSSLTPRTVSNSKGLALTWKKTGGEVGTARETVAGVNNGEIYAVCEDGTRVQGTFVIGSGTASGTGQASDTNGNVYKLLF